MAGVFYRKNMLQTTVRLIRDASKKVNTLIKWNQQ